MTEQGAGQQGMVAWFSQGQEIFVFPEFPDWLWGPASLLFSRYLVPFEDLKVQIPINNFKKLFRYIVHNVLLSYGVFSHKIYVLLNVIYSVWNGAY